MDGAPPSWKLVGKPSRFTLAPLRATIGAVPLLLFAAAPLAAECECTVTVTTADLTWTSKSTSTGVCPKTTLLTLSRDGIQVGHKDCGITTTCTSETTRSTACLRTGVHDVRLHCGCGKLGTDVHGNPICDFDSGDDATSFFVDTTPTVDVEVAGPETSPARSR